MVKIKKSIKNLVTCLLLVFMMLGGNFFWLSNSKVFADTMIIYGTSTDPAGMNNALRDDDGGATEQVNGTPNYLTVTGFNSENLGTIDSIEVYYKIPSATVDTSKGSTSWTLKMIYGPDTTNNVVTVKTGTNVAPLATETQIYPTKPNGQAWQWSDLPNIQLTINTLNNQGNKSVYNVDAFFIKVNYTTTPVGDITPPTFNLSYYQDELLTEPLPEKVSDPVTNNKTVYIKAIPNEPLSEDPFINVAAPGTGNDISNSYMTYMSGGYYVFPWTVKSGEGDGLATITVTGKDQASTPNTGSSQGMVSIDTTIFKPELNVTSGSLKADLSWSTTDTDIQEFKLYKSTSANFTIGLDNLIQTFNGNISSYTDSNVVVGQTYYYKLVSKDIAGNGSVPSTEVSATPFQDTTKPDFKVEYFKDPNFTAESKLEVWQGLPITKLQTVYLRIETNEDLLSNPTVTINAPGTINDNTTQSTEKVSSNIFRYPWNLQSGDQDGIANVFISGEDLYGNKAIEIQPVTGGKIQIDSTVSITQWTYGYPLGGMGYVDLGWLNTDSDIKNFQIYRDIYSEFTIDQTTNTNLLLSLTGNSYRDTTATAPNTYYYKIIAMDFAGNTSISQEVYASPEKVNPHGYYTTNTDMCAQCHEAHGGKDKYNLKEKTKDVCYVCHDAGGQSSYFVKGEMSLAGSHHPVDLASSTQPADSLSCSDCHNPHLEWETVSRLLTTRNNAMSGNEVCFTCHGSSASGTQNKKSLYPASGVGHNNNNWIAPNGLRPFAGEYSSPATGTNIGCVGCHEEHGSGIAKLLRPLDWNSDSIFPSQNNKNFCYECHKEPLNTSKDNAWDGSSIYDSQGQPKHNGSGSQCTTCHDPHGSNNGNYLKASYDSSNRGIERTKAYDPNDYNACTKCHTKITDLVDPGANTGFSYIRQDWPTEKQNLHYYHLNQLAAKGLGNAVCKECHRTHGTLAEENPARTSLVGFPSSTVSALTGNSSPIFEDNGDTGGNCTVVCHGVTHKAGTPQTGEVDSTYLGSAPSGGGLSSGGQDCAICHNNNAGTSKLIDRMKAATGGFKHLIDSTNTYDYAYSPNATSCLNTCHVDHDLFNNNMGANLRTSVTDTSPTTGVNTDFIGTRTDGGICASCHKEVVSKRYDLSIRGLFTKAIDPAKYKLSAHGYEVTTNFSYDSSTFKANCVKCHNDNIGKDSTGSVVMTNPEFAMHESTYKFIVSPFGILSPPNPLGQKHCYGCHGSTGEYYKTPNQVAGDIETDFKKPYRHKIESSSTWNWKDCEDCHDTHSAKKGNRLSGTGGSTINFNTVSPSMVGATGVKVVTWTDPAETPGQEVLWSPADSSNYQEVVLQETDPAYYSAYVCLKCHSSYVSTLPDSVSATGEKTKDKAKDFNPNNLSLHPVFAPRTDTTRTLGSTANRQSMLKAPWSQTSPSTQMTCIDCHNADSGGSGPFGVHGSNNPFMLRAYGTQPGANGGGTYDKLCYLCHIPTSSAFKSHQAAAHSSNDLGCLACHAGPAGKVAANNGGRRGSIHGSNFVWSSGTPAKTMLMGGYITDITGRNCTVSGCTNHTKPW